ncbi:protein disulfide-isomerase [Lathyrus oleraceus]|nr:protein disulfide-isomerase-like [Pisum sativum]
MAPPTVLPPGYDANIRCDFHSGAPGHHTEKCRAFQHKVQDLIDSKAINFSPVPNVVNNPMPQHGGHRVNCVEGAEAEDFVVRVDEIQTPFLTVKGRLLGGGVYPGCGKDCLDCAEVDNGCDQLKAGIQKLIDEGCVQFSRAVKDNGSVSTVTIYFKPAEGRGQGVVSTSAASARTKNTIHQTLDAKYLPRGDSSVSGPVVRLFKPFDELFVDSKDFNVEALLKFVEESSIPLVTIFNNEPSDHPFVVKYFNSPKAKAMLFANFTSASTEAFKAKYREIAEQYKQQGISFLIGDVESNQGAFQYFGLKEDQVPLIIIRHTDGKKFFKPNLEPDHLATWLKAYKDGDVAPFVKSEPIPATNNEPVKVVVGETLQEIVFNSGKNVLLEFYAPWCGHCKSLAPILDEVAVSFQSDPDVVIAKLDATANDIPSDTFEVQDYPTLYFRSASGKISQYDGGRTKEDIIEFIQKNKDTTGAAQQEVEQPKAPAQQTDQLTTMVQPPPSLKPQPTNGEK